MKLLKYSLPALLLGSLLTGGCKSDEKSGEMTPAAREHAAFRASLRDSMNLYNSSAASLKSETDTLQKEFEALYSRLEVDDRKEYVEIYRVAKGWKNYDTMSGTGLLARILENGNVEVIASSDKGSFSSIELSSEGDRFITEKVPESAGFNYTVGNQSRVTFSGNDALAICNFALSHKDSAIKVIFRGAKSNTISLTNAQIEMLAIIAETVGIKEKLDKTQAEYMKAFNKYNLYLEEVRKDSLKASETVK